MAATYANIFPTPAGDGTVYASSKVMPSLEADLQNAPVPPAESPIHIAPDQAIVATVKFTSTGGPSTNSSYVVLQSRLAGGDWYDVAWCLWTGTQGTAFFVLSTAAWAANVFQQTRAVGTAPGSNGNNNCVLGGEVRFVGKSQLGASSSSSAGGQPPTQVSVDIVFKLLGLR